MSRASILIVEDEPALLRGLRDSFHSHGLDVRTETNGEAGLSSALDHPPDIILLDLMLPRINGYEVCRALREHGLDVPIVMLTAKGQEEDVILGLNLGADDYVTKPFRLRELMARVDAFLRRVRSKSSQTSAFGDFLLDSSAHKLFRSGEEVVLTSKEFRLLSYMVSRQGRALARNDILDAVWGNSVMVTPRSVDRCVATLRAKIEPDARHPTYIQTIRDIGYRFVPANLSE